MKNEAFIIKSYFDRTKINTPTSTDDLIILRLHKGPAGQQDITCKLSDLNTIMNPLSLVTSGTPVNSVAADEVLTVAGIPSNADTVTIGIIIYTFKTVITSAYDVLIGISAEASIDNLISAINATSGEGSTYGSGTLINSLVNAVKTTAATITVTAKIAGIIGNLIDINKSGTNLSWAASAVLLSGGIDGTVGIVGQSLFDATNLYICTDTNTIADANWKKLTLLSL